jgi:galactose mutarotase-like enzyme
MVIVKGSKKVSEIVKGDVVKVDGKPYEVDAHEVLIDHGKNKEMSIEMFDKKTDKDFQLRYFDNDSEGTVEFYELKDIVYDKIEIKKVEW